MKCSPKTLLAVAILFGTAYTASAQAGDPLSIDNDGKVNVSTVLQPAKVQMAGNSDGSIHTNGNPIYLRTSLADKMDVIRWNPSDDKVYVAGWTGIMIGYTVGSTQDNVSIKPIITASPNKVDVTGDLTVTGRVKDQTGYLVPQGGIIMYTGNSSELFDGSGKGIGGSRVEGWALCNGQNGTPNLLNRFVTGAGPGSGYGANSGAVGGEDRHTLSIAEMPNHDHDWAFGCDNSGGSNLKGAKDGYQSNSPCLWGKTSKVGGGQSFENRPQYYAVFYIMKL